MQALNFHGLFESARGSGCARPTQLRILCQGRRASRGGKTGGGARVSLRRVLFLVRCGRGRLGTLLWTGPVRRRPVPALAGILLLQRLRPAGSAGGAPPPAQALPPVS